MCHLRTARWDLEMNTGLFPGDGASRPASSRSGPFSKTVAVLVMVVGAGLIAITFFFNLFAVGPAFENLTVDFRPALTQSSIDTARTDIESLKAVEKEFTNKLIPALSQQLKMTPGEFSEYLSQNFPSVAAGMNELPTVVPTFTGLIDTLDSQRPLFASADTIPTKDLPATTVPWAIFGAGLVVFLIGLLMLALPKTGAVAAVLVGLLLLLAPFAISLPAKGADADQLNANLKPIYTQTLVSDASGAVVAIEAMGNEMQSAMLPALATQLEMDSEELATFITINFPATAKALQTMPTSMQRFKSLVQIFDTNLANFDTLKPVSLTSLIAIVMTAGGLVALFGILVLLKRRQN